MGKNMDRLGDDRATSSCLRRYYRTELDHLAYLRFVVESYEGMAQITSLPGRCEVEWTIPWQLADQAEALARALASEITLVPIAPPDDWPDRPGSP